MSELIDNSQLRQAKLKELILKLHKGESEARVKEELVQTLRKVPYVEVIAVEQELINEGLPTEEVLRLCDVHSSVLQGNVDLSGASNIPKGHPIDIMIKENVALRQVTAQATYFLVAVEKTISDDISKHIMHLRELFNQLADVDKHYQRKEYLLFPYLEKAGITGPPKVMWGKHDEIRELVSGGIKILRTENIGKEELLAVAEIVLKPALIGIDEMTIKEEEILFPMAMDKLTEQEWLEVSQQSLEIGFCLVDPEIEWEPSLGEDQAYEALQSTGDAIQLPTGSFTATELISILNTLPVDITFVGKDDKVKYYSRSTERIFQRNRAILNRDVRHCHPPASTHIVEKILEDFKSGKQDRAPFWINMGDKLIHIEYFALRDKDGSYLGTLEVSQDLTTYRALQGEQRILSYAEKDAQ
ncbi:MAG: DUF438 domain-containing protein [Anaerolineae bacterium]|nr:DUF438 domain-containing protein [Anaerolineae bacterium]